MIRGSNGATLRGVAIGAAAGKGTPVRLEVTLYDTGDPVGSGLITIEAPARGAKAPFTATIPATSTPTSYSYRVVE
jgi:hypothetical protein